MIPYRRHLIFLCAIFLTSSMSPAAKSKPGSEARCALSIYTEGKLTRKLGISVEDAQALLDFGWADEYRRAVDLYRLVQATGAGKLKPAVEILNEAQKSGEAFGPELAARLFAVFPKKPEENLPEELQRFFPVRRKSMELPAQWQSRVRRFVKENMAGDRLNRFIATSMNPGRRNPLVGEVVEERMGAISAAHAMEAAQKFFVGEFELVLERRPSLLRRESEIISWTEGQFREGNQFGFLPWVHSEIAMPLIPIVLQGSQNSPWRESELKEVLLEGIEGHILFLRERMWACLRRSDWSPSLPPADETQQLRRGSYRESVNRPGELSPAVLRREAPSRSMIQSAVSEHTLLRFDVAPFVDFWQGLTLEERAILWNALLQIRSPDYESAIRRFTEMGLVSQVPGQPVFVLRALRQDPSSKGVIVFGHVEGYFAVVDWRRDETGTWQPAGDTRLNDRIETLVDFLTEP